MSDVRLRAWQRWQAAAGPWRGWAICPSLTMPLEDTWPESSPSIPTAARHFTQIDEVLRNGATALVVDMGPLTGVHIAAGLSQRHQADVVLVLPRWPHAEATLPCHELVASLVASSRRLSAGSGSTNVVFVLDADRAGTLHRPSRDARVDNRYDIAVADLPDLAQLRAAGVQRVVKLNSARPS